MSSEISNEKTITKAQVKKDLKNLGYHEVSIITHRSKWLEETYAQIYVYDSDGECLVGDDDVYYMEKYEQAEAALDYIHKLPKCFDTGEIIYKK